MQRLMPAVVGTCLDDEQPNPGSGDTLQHTTGGLFVWRKHPQVGTRNSTAFTDGYHTWVSGPDGIQERLNSQRFTWEANPTGLPAVPPGRCRSNEMVLSQQHGQVAAGMIGISFQLRSTAAASCTLYGFPGVQQLGGTAQPIPTYLHWSTTRYLIGAVPERTITLAPGAGVYFVLEFSDVPNAGQPCLAAGSVRITPPNAYRYVVGQVHGIAPCGGMITASPVLTSDPLALPNA